MTVRNYAILYIGNKRNRSGSFVGSGSIVEGGNGITETEQHVLDGLSHTNLDAYVKSTAAGEEGFLDHGSTGATETITPADANWHSITLNANCTLTLGAVTDDKGCSLVVEITQDATGGWTIDLPASVANAAALEAAQVTTAETTAFLVLISRDGGVNWYGFWAGGGGSSLVVSEEGTPLATAATSLDFVGAGVVASGVAAAKTITISGAPTGAAGGDLAGTYPNPTLNSTSLQAAGHFELLMDGGSPPAPLEDGTGTDWLYVWVP